MKDNSRFITFSVLCVLFTLALFFRSNTAVIAEDLLRDFAVPATSLGLMSSAFFYAYAAVQAPVGMLSDRIGVTKTVFFFGLIGVVGAALFSFSTNIHMATWARLLTGAGTAGIWIPSLKYLSIKFKPSEFATLTSIINAVGALGLLFGTLPMALLVAATSWRFAYLISAAVLFFLILLARFLMKEKAPAGHKLNNNTEKEIKQSPALHFSFLKHRAYWRFALWAFLMYGVFFSFFGLWGATYLQEIFHVSKESAATTLMFTSLGMIIGGLFWGVVSEHFFKARRPVLILGTAGVFLVFIILLLLPSFPGSFCMNVLFFILGFSIIVFLITLGCVKELFPVEIAGSAMGIVNAAMFAGVAVFQAVTGFLIDYFTKGSFGINPEITAFRSIFYLYLGSTALACILTILLPETYPRQPAEKQKTSPDM